MKNLKRLVVLKFARKMGSGKTVSVPSIISDNAKFKGNIVSDGIVHIDGQLTGDISCEELVIGIKGQVKGKINAKRLYVYGIFDGIADVESLFIAKTAKLKGDVSHNNIAIEPGAYIDGRCLRKDGGASNISMTEKKAKKE